MSCTGKRQGMEKGPEFEIAGKWYERLNLDGGAQQYRI